MDESKKATAARDRPSHCHIHTEDSRDLKKTVGTVPGCQEPSAVRLHCSGQHSTAQTGWKAPGQQQQRLQHNQYGLQKKIKDHVCPLVEQVSQYRDET